MFNIKKLLKQKFAKEIQCSYVVFMRGIICHGRITEHYMKCARWNNQQLHERNLGSRQESSPWPPEHRPGAVFTELRELRKSKAILLSSYMTLVLHTARICNVDVIINCDKWKRLCSGGHRFDFCRGLYQRKKKKKKRKKGNKQQTNKQTNGIENGYRSRFRTRSGACLHTL